MTIRATQGIASGYGTYAPGDLIDTDMPEPVRDAWLAAGIAVDEPEPAAEKPKRAAPVERATVKAPEAAVGRRLRSNETPQRRFVANTAERTE
ncbi:MAG TPA: hypothetical protein VFG00_09150 [Acidothermaceae bacterium]|nr:hypothetical protein [Acidothermaceae bacterium]